MLLRSPKRIINSRNAGRRYTECGQETVYLARPPQQPNCLSVCQPIRIGSHLSNKTLAQPTEFVMPHACLPLIQPSTRPSFSHQTLLKHQCFLMGHGKAFYLSERFVDLLRPQGASLSIKGCKKEQARQCLGFCTACFWSWLVYESAVQKPKHCFFLLPMLSIVI